jgi:hypothetical protein
MKSKQFIFSLILTGMALGTAWAVRGQFGHEQGAAWAGSVGAISIILLSGRADWRAKLFKATLAAAIGWGLGGIMSYGIVVGYGHGIDFVNVYYGLLMLFVIGGLHGVVGGGLFGLTLADNGEKKANWLVLFAGMVASGLTAYFFIIMEWEWLMTPPRSEVWAVCLGMAIFLIWYLVYTKSWSALRVAVFAGLGGGFGFAFGNFLQVLGRYSEIPFNFWNVMEYSIGFFGGVGMAYGTFTSQWDSVSLKMPRKSTLVPMLLLVLFIPFVVWQQSMEVERLEKNYTDLIQSDPNIMAHIIRYVSLGIILTMTGWVFVKYYSSRDNLELNYTKADVYQFLGLFLGVYIVYSLLITGAWVSTYRIEQYLYLVNLGIILLAIPKMVPEFLQHGISSKRWMVGFVIVIAVIALLALIAINSHDAPKNLQRRFEF